MLRPYQKESVSKMLWSMSLPGNDIIVLPTGAGKTHVIADFTEKVGQPVLILVPNKELLEQDFSKLKLVVPETEIGIYSASMNSKEVKRYTLATIQSAYKHPEHFTHYKVVLIDECDLLNPKNMDGMYMSFFKAIGNPKIIGLTATPWRQDLMYRKWGRQKWQVESITTTKMIQRMKPFVWNRMLHVINTHELLEGGYLCPIEYHDASIITHEEIPTNKSNSDFNLEKFEEMIADQKQKTADFIHHLPHSGKLVFCATITQANDLQELIPGSVVVTSQTKAKDRAKAVEGLRNGSIATLLNVGIYTVGFDYPQLDCIVLLRPTRSLRLHCQIIGRVSRIADGKSMGHVYDLVNNIKSMGKLADIKIQKVDGKWNVTSSTYPSGFHQVPLYSYKLQRRKVVTNVKND